MLVVRTRLRWHLFLRLSWGVAPGWYDPTPLASAQKSLLKGNGFRDIGRR